MKRISSVPRYGTQVILCFMPKNTASSILPRFGIPSWAVSPDCLRFLPQRADRHHRNLTSTTACWLISRSIIIGHSHLRTCLPQTSCTPVVPLGSLDAIFFMARQTRKSGNCHRSVIAPRLRLHEWLMYLDCWIWLARHRVIPCCSRSQIHEYPLRHLSRCISASGYTPPAVYGHPAGTMFPLFLRGFQKRPTV